MKILKIGGSVLTDKTGFEEPRKNEVKRIAAEVAKKPENLVLIHGAGSFGHPHVEKYLEKNKGKELLEASKIHAAVSKLTWILIDSLRKEKISCLPVRPLSCSTATDGNLKEMYTEPVKNMFKKNILPILHGDIVTSKKGVTVVSGDEILVYLGKKMDAENIGFGTDVKGVLDKKGSMIKTLSKEKIEKINFFEGNGTDFTGGMEKKIKSLEKLGISGRIFDATHPGNVEKFLKGKELGTEFSF